MGKVRGYKDYEFKGIDCMISLDAEELGFFKDINNDRRPSQATYISLEDAEKLFKIFSDVNSEFERTYN